MKPSRCCAGVSIFFLAPALPQSARNILFAVIRSFQVCNPSPLGHQPPAALSWPASPLPLLLLLSVPHLGYTSSHLCAGRFPASLLLPHIPAPSLPPTLVRHHRVCNHDHVTPPRVLYKFPNSPGGSLIRLLNWG